ncbi:MAG: hypothetical protein KF850_35105 [Labilithrix sp.]|nr:hypothetical protein [Labilithrix sp.]
MATGSSFVTARASSGSPAGAATRARVVTKLGCLGALAFTLGCGPAPPVRGPYTIVNGDPRGTPPVPNVGQAEWTLSRERLGRMRSALPKRPYVGRVKIGVVDPRTGKVYQARGAVAVSPDRAARLVLLGPGGTTAMDVWVTRERYRLSIPSINLEQRGGVDLAGARGLPIGFLRWWFVSPLEGKLVLARSNKHESVFLLRDGGATVTLRTDGERFIAIRREGGRLDGLDWSGRGLAPRAGARGRYIDGEWGLRVDVLVEDVLDEEPDPEAFLDPDEKGTSL